MGLTGHDGFDDMCEGSLIATESEGQLVGFDTTSGGPIVGLEDTLRIGLGCRECWRRDGSARSVWDID